MNIDKILPPKVSKELKKHGFKTVQSCVAAGEIELLRIKGIGPGRFELIEVEAITKLNLSSWTTDWKKIALLKFLLGKYGPTGSSRKARITVWEARKFVLILESEGKLKY